MEINQILDYVGQHNRFVYGSCSPCYFVVVGNMLPNDEFSGPTYNIKE